MKVVSTEGLTKLIQLIKSTFIPKTDTEQTIEIDTEIASEVTLATVATTGNYTDLSNTPTIPTVNNTTITFQKNETTIDSFTTNTASAKTINITVPTDTNDLTNGAGYITGITSSDVTTALGYTPYDSNNPNGYTSNIGTVTSVNNINPINGNVTISIPTDTSDLTNTAGFITSSSLPSIATTSVTGLVKPDGTSITIDANGTISSIGGTESDNSTITKNQSNQLQTVAIKNQNTNEGVQNPLKIWQGTEAQWNNGEIVETYYYWKTLPVESSWTDISLTLTQYWKKIVYGGGKFVATGGSSQYAYSTDGVNWTENTDPNNGIVFQNLLYANNTFFAYSQSAQQTGYYSTDGINWTELETAIDTETNSSTLFDVIYGGRKFVAIGYDKGISYYSTDGINWNKNTCPTAAIIKLVYGNGIYLGISDGYGRKYLYSSDGINWIEKTTFPNSDFIYSAAFGNNTFIVSGYNAIYYSTDGINWTKQTINYSIDNIKYENGIFIGFKRSGSANIFYKSEDGINWTTEELPSTHYWSGVAYGNDKYVITSGKAYDESSNVFTYKTSVSSNCYTLNEIPTTSSTVYSDVDTPSSLTISSVGENSITLSDSKTYYYNSTYNIPIYQTIGDIYSNYLCFINDKCIKIGNTTIAEKLDPQLEIILHNINSGQ